MKQRYSLLVLAIVLASSLMAQQTDSDSPVLAVCPAAPEDYCLTHIDTLTHCLRMRNDTAAVYIYHSVPYAYAERFRQPVLADGIEPADDYIHSNVACYQRTFAPDTTQQYSEAKIVLSEDDESPLTEDCLVLTINSPKPLDAAPKANMPVLVYIHGGNYYAGGGERVATQLAEFALREQVVTVTVTYRLGIFGYLYQPDSASVNLGLQDQLTALRWVHDNIARFGGDADNITLAGQSAGAQSVVYCLADTARVPIRRAVVFSAPMGLTTSKCSGNRRTRFVRRYLSPQDPWTCPADTLMAAQNHYMQTHTAAWHSLPFSPTGIPQMPAYGKQVNWPQQVVVCVQKDDGSMFGPEPMWKMLTDVVFASPAKRYTRYLQKQGVDAQYHLFTWEPQDSPLKAAHCAELPLLLDGTEEYWVGSWIMGDVSADEIRAKRAPFMDGFARFMRTGEWTLQGEY